MRIYALCFSTLLIAGCSAQNLKPQGSWQLQRVVFVQQTAMPVQGSFSIHFADNQASGMVTCNRWHSTISTLGNTIKFIQPGTTRKACKTALQEELAITYLHALERGGQWVTNADEASFTNPDGTVWYFIRH